MRQYLRELQSQQTRFNLNVLIRVAEMEDRVGRLEEAAVAAPAPAGGAPEAGSAEARAIVEAADDAAPAPPAGPS